MNSIVISGASRGLGAELARGWAGPGVALHLIGRDAVALEAVAADCRARGAVVHTALLDVRDAPALSAQVLAWDNASPFTLVVANAGVTGGTRPDGGMEGHESTLRVLGVNLTGAVNLVEPLLPRLVARGAGRLVLVCSVAAFRGLPDSPAYSASKAGLWAYGEALRALLALRGVGVTMVAPGFFRSEMSAKFKGGHPFEYSVEAAGAKIRRAVARGAGRCVFPWGFGMMLRLLELMPAPVADKLTRLFRFKVDN
jgi:short-subunit dehydrogenase